MRRINAAGLDLIKAFEGCRLTAYRDPVGVWTVGYGSTGAHVRRGVTLAPAQAEQLLRDDLDRFEAAVAAATRHVPTTDNQFAAMVSMAFNCGEGAFLKSSIRRWHVAGKPRLAAAAFLLWIKAGGRPLRGLIRRRTAESRLYLRPDDATVGSASRTGPAAGPSPRYAVRTLRPRPDDATIGSASRTGPAAELRGMLFTVAAMGTIIAALMMTGCVRHELTAPQFDDALAGLKAETAAMNSEPATAREAHPTAAARGARPTVGSAPRTAPEARPCPTLELPPIPDDVVIDIKGDKITANAGGEVILRGYVLARSCLRGVP